MNAETKYYQLIPEKVFQNLNTIEDLLRPGIKGFSSDYLKEIISIIACHVRNEEGSAQLQVTFIKKLVPQGDKYLSGLIDLGIIERSGNAVKGQTSYKYIFSPEYQSKYLSFPLNNASLIRRIKNAQETFRKEAAKSIRGHSEQTKYLKQLTIESNYKSFIDSNYTSETDQYNSILGSATRIINGDTSKCSIDNTSGRFHSIITNMAKVLRPYLRINGEPLANMDVKNSQLYLSTIILTNPSKVSWMTENPAFAMLLQTLKVSQQQDVIKFIQLSVLGQIYEYLMTEFAKEGLNLTRAETKRQVLRILFARNRLPKDEINRKCRLIFKDRFPTVHRIFSKVRGHEKGDKFQNFKRFAILLQRIESYLMLDVILKRIYKELPGTIAVTIHDSIMTGILTNNVEAVRKIMNDELTFFIGFAPKIKIELNIEMEEEEGGACTISNQYVATNLETLN
ncbi:MAG: hypothetical protein IMZ64_01770 [Bacteroidetes bacterium]|nr:hypothetical protein [Bacteroidota bacterium]